MKQLITTMDNVFLFRKGGVAALPCYLALHPAVCPLNLFDVYMNMYMPAPHVVYCRSGLQWL